MNCRFCGSAVAEGAKFCPCCGTTAADAVGASVQSTGAVNMQPTMGATTPVNDTQQSVYYGASNSQSVYTQGSSSVYGQTAYASQSPYGQTAYASQNSAYNNGFSNQNYQNQLVGVNPINPIAEAEGKSVMIKGIVSLALCSVPVAPIVLGAMALSGSNSILQRFSYLPTKGKVGRHLGRAGLIIGCIMVFYWIIMIVAIAGEL